MSHDMAIFWAVVLGRLLLPLLIPRYPLPGVILCLLLDGVDQTIFQNFTKLPLEGYQSYDKALDIYYLTIAYVTTMRNWTNHFAFRVSQFLFYYRLVGALLFELIQWRTLLLIFPNTFEYFFIFYEAVRLRWNPSRMTKRVLIGAAAFIWIVIKLPQEYWIHVAQMDATDFIKETIFGVPTTASLMQAFAAKPLLVVLAVVAVVVLLALAYSVITRKLPPADHKLQLAADPIPTDVDEARERRSILARFGRIFDAALLEKIVLISFVTIIFSQILPNFRSTPIQIVIGVAFIIVVNTALSLALARRGKGVNSAVVQFLVTMAVNAAIVFGLDWLLPRANGSINVPDALFFLLLLSLLVTLYDMYRPIYLARFQPQVRESGTG